LCPSCREANKPSEEELLAINIARKARQNENKKEWRKRNPEKMKAIYAKRIRYPLTEHDKEVSRTSRRLKARKHQEYVAIYKQSQGCLDCGYKAHPAALQLDHVRGTKRAVVGHLYGKSLQTIINEIEKCEVRCANCHAIRHFEEKRLERDNRDSKSMDSR
jgi:hypothetical protein